jgi:septal ring factor EnvC (AmiA/AmiB activator)
MNALGKFLVAAIMVFSVIFMAFAIAVFTTHKNWRDEAEKLEKDVQSKKTEIANLNEVKLALIKQQTDATGRMSALLAKAQTTLTTKTQELEKLQLDNIKTKEANNRLLLDLNLAEEELKKRLKDIDEYLATIDAEREQRNELFNDLVQTTEEHNQVKNELQRVKDYNTRLTELMAQAKKVVDRLGGHLAMSVDDKPPPVDGVVLDVRKDAGVERVEISLGYQDGLAEGHKLSLYRKSAGQSKYLGEIEITRTWPDRAVGRVLPEYKRGNIERDDRVASRLD